MSVLEGRRQLRLVRPGHRDDSVDVVVASGVALDDGGSRAEAGQDDACGAAARRLARAVGVGAGADLGDHLVGHLDVAVRGQQQARSRGPLIGALAVAEAIDGEHGIAFPGQRARHVVGALDDGRAAAPGAPLGHRAVLQQEGGRARAGPLRRAEEGAADRRWDRVTGVVHREAHILRDGPLVVTAALGRRHVYALAPSPRVGDARSSSRVCDGADTAAAVLKAGPAAGARPDPPMLDLARATALPPAPRAGRCRRLADRDPDRDALSARAARSARSPAPACRASCRSRARRSCWRR